ncbi:MAG: hypothetical protein WC710_09280 [Gallionella sp.]|jgi:hypothetical protein
MIDKMMKHQMGKCGYVTANSCTKDDAVKIMLGLLSEPVNWVCEDERDYDYFPDPALSLMEELEDLIDDARTEYYEAKEDGASEDILDVKKAAVAMWREKKITAIAYLRHIEDELAKGEHASELRTVQEMAYGAMRPQITICSLDQLSRKYYQIPILNVLSANQDVQPIAAPSKQLRTKMLDQEDAILAEIRLLGGDPQALPMYSKIEAGIKSDVKSALVANPLFESSSAFKNAWDSLLLKKMIKYVKKVSSL